MKLSTAYLFAVHRTYKSSIALPIIFLSLSLSLQKRCKTLLCLFYDRYKRNDFEYGNKHKVHCSSQSSINESRFPWHTSDHCNTLRTFFTFKPGWNWLNNSLLTVFSETVYAKIVQPSVLRHRMEEDTVSVLSNSISSKKGELVEQLFTYNLICPLCIYLTTTPCEWFYVFCSQSVLPHVLLLINTISSQYLSCRLLEIRVVHQSETAR